MRALSLLLLAGLLAGCGATRTEYTQKKAEVEGAELRARGAEAAAQAGRSYVAHPDRGARLVIGRKAVESALEAYLPYTFRGDSLSKQIKGSFKLFLPRDLEFLPGNRGRLKLSLDGDKVTVKSGGAVGSQKDQERLQDGLASGATLDVEFALWVDKGKLQVKPRCLSAKLGRQHSEAFDALVCGWINDSLFADAEGISLPAALSDRKADVLVTPHHIVFLAH